MGWWSTDILGGDPPLDALCEIEHIVGIEDLYPLDMWDDNQRAQLPALINEHRSELLTYAASDTVAGQVVGVFLLAAGASLDDNERTIICDAARNDEWARENVDRAHAVTALGTAVENYDGTPTVWHQAGLFETIADHLKA